MPTLVVRGVSITEDDPHSALIHFNRPLTREELKELHGIVHTFKGIPDWIIIGGRQIFHTLMTQHFCIHKRSLKTTCYECHEYQL